MKISNAIRQVLRKGFTIRLHTVWAVLVILNAPVVLQAQSTPVNGVLHVTSFDDSGLPGTMPSTGYIQLQYGSSLIYDGTYAGLTTFELNLHGDSPDMPSTVTVTNPGVDLVLYGGVTSFGSFGLAGNLVKDGPGTLWLLGANTYTSTIINEGTLVFTSFGEILKIFNPLIFQTGPGGNPGKGFISINNGATLRFAGTHAVSDMYTGIGFGPDGGNVEVIPGSEAEFAGRMFGTTMTKTGAGILTLSNPADSVAPSILEGIIIKEGFVNVRTFNNDGEVGPLGPGTVTTEGGYLMARGDKTANRTLHVGAGGGGLASFGGVLTWNGTIEVADGATFSVTGDGVVALNGYNGFDFKTRVTESHLRAIDGVGLSAGHLTLDDGILQSGGLFTRSLGTEAGQVTLEGEAGFSAVGQTLSVGLNGSRTTLNWSDLGDLSALVLNDQYATHRLTLSNTLVIDPGVTATIRSDKGEAYIYGGVRGGGTLEIRGAGSVEVNVDDNSTLWVHGGTARGVDATMPNAMLKLEDGIFQTFSSFTRSLGTTPGTVSMQGASGFSAVGGDLTVNLGGAGAKVSSADLPSTLVLNDAFATNTLDWINPIELEEGDTLTIRPGTVLTKMHGEISGLGNLAVQGGYLEFLVDHTFSGLMIFDGSHVIVPTIRNLGEASALGRGNLQVANGATLEYIGPTISTGRAFGSQNVTDTITLVDNGGTAIYGAMNTIKVTNPGTRLTFEGPLTGNAGLTVTGDGTLEFPGNIQMKETASVIVNGGGTLVLTGLGNSTSGSFHVANLEGSRGTVELLNGYLVTGESNYTHNVVDSTSPEAHFENNYSADSTIGYGQDSSGTMTVSGANTTWESRGNISVGFYGQGQLTLSDGATIKVGTGAASGVPDAAGTGVTETLYIRTGTLDIGSHDLSAPSIGGAIEASRIILTSGTGKTDFSNDLFTRVNREFIEEYAGGTHYPGFTSLQGGPMSWLNFNQTDTVTINSAIGGFGDVTQRGSGTTILTGNSDETYYLYNVFHVMPAGSSSFISGNYYEQLGFHGRVLVSNGTLLVNGKLTSNSTTVSDGATLGGSGIITNIVLENGGRLAPGEDTGISIGTLSSDTLTWNSGATLNFDLGESGLSDKLSLTGALLKGTDGLFQFTFNDAGWQLGQTYTLAEFSSTDFSDYNFGFTNADGFGGIFSLSGNSLTFTLAAVPEPSTWTLLAASAVLLIAARFHRRKS